MNPLDTFDPNDHSKHEWATYCVRRNGAAFKVHRHRKDAMAAMRRHLVGVLYVWDFQWRELLRCDPRDVPYGCEQCLTPFKPAIYSGWFPPNCAPHFYVEKDEPKVKFLCTGCVRDARA